VGPQAVDKEGHASKPVRASSCKYKCMVYGGITAYGKTALVFVLTARCTSYN
jgi:hypothetical protein